MQQTVVPILGMHRSGTSMLTRMLNIMGVELGEPLQPAGFDNPKGFWENRFFQSSNINILGQVGCNSDGFDSSENIIKACLDLNEVPIPDQAMSQIEEYFGYSFQNTHWGWKDPRSVITWPFWNRCLAQLGYLDIRPVVVVRHPNSCIQSLQKRGDFKNVILPEGVTLEEYLAGIWKSYYELLDAYLPQDALVLLQEDLLNIKEATADMARCAQYLGLNGVGISPALATIDVNLVSHRNDDNNTIENPDVQELFQKFVHRAKQQKESFSLKNRTNTLAVGSLPGTVADKYCIYIVSPENYVHSHAFDEHALAMHYAFHDLGYIAPIVRQAWEISGTPIILGPNLLPTIKDNNVPPDSILYNLEQILEGSSWLEPVYIDLLSKYKVWDYSEQNIVALQQLGVENVTHCPVGYVPELSCIEPLPEAEKNIDVLFYGSLNDRRKEILDQLESRGLKVASFFGVYGNRRDLLVARAKIVINIHFYESKVLEIIRLSYLLANNTFVISERGNDVVAERPFEEAVAFAGYDELVETCLAFIDNPQGRQEIAARGHKIFSAHKQANYLNQALGNDN